MFCSMLSGIVSGAAGCIIQVEAELRSGLPYFTMVGRLSNEAKESRHRVESALRALGLSLIHIFLDQNIRWPASNSRESGRRKLIWPETEPYPFRRFQILRKIKRLINSERSFLIQKGKQHLQI